MQHQAHRDFSRLQSSPRLHFLIVMLYFFALIIGCFVVVGIIIVLTVFMQVCYVILIRTVLNDKYELKYCGLETSGYKNVKRLSFTRAKKLIHIFVSAHPDHTVALLSADSSVYTGLWRLYKSPSVKKEN